MDKQSNNETATLPDGCVDLTAGDPAYEDLTDEEREIGNRIIEKMTAKRTASVKELGLIADSLSLLNEMKKCEGDFKGRLWKGDTCYYIQFGKNSRAFEIPFQVLGEIMAHVTAAISSGGQTYSKIEVTW